jgi:hypothetical protein
MNFSVLMSLYNGEKRSNLSDCFDSLCQSEIDIPEIILVLDGPVRDELTSLIEFYMKKLPIKVIPITQNVGLALALNHGIKFCSSEFIARFDMLFISGFFFVDRFQIFGYTIDRSCVKSHSWSQRFGFYCLFNYFFGSFSHNASRKLLSDLF